ncbi:MAG TPA: phosphoribosylamine--glycine ligase, partial [Gemmatimonadaceae bacterium]
MLVVGGGGREHALGWKLLRDDPRTELIAAPGNPGLAELGRCVSIAASDVAALAALARAEEVALTIVGPEAPLEAGLVDHFREAGLPVFGPSKAAARIETSKRFAKELMLDAGVPTARAWTFSDAAERFEVSMRA